MSWPQWSTNAQQGAAVPPVLNTAAPLINSAPAVAPPSSLQYTPDQWAQMQQQNWSQWAQWQQQYQQWHQQYGAEYQKSMNALAQASQQAVPGISQPPLPTEPKPPLPADDPPPPIPSYTTQSNNYTTSSYNAASQPPVSYKQPTNANYNTAGGNNYNTTPQYQNKFNNPAPQQPLSNNYSTGKPSQQQFHQKNQQWQNQGRGNFNQQSSNKRSFDQAPDYEGAKRTFSGNTDFQTQRPVKPQSQGVPPKRENLEELTEAERKFDKQFADWEAQFNKWKEQNVEHPDKAQYKEYEKKWETWRAQLLERREQMRRKRLALTSDLAKTRTQPASSQNITQPAPIPPLMTQKPPEMLPNSASQFNNPPPNMNNEPLSFKAKQPVDEEGTADFLRTSSNSDGGIPGLDLVKDDGKSQKTEDVVVIDGDKTELQNEKKGPDFEAISKGINNILGDPNLMSMLSMVSQNQNIKTDDNLITSVSKIKDNSNYDSSNQGFPEQSNQSFEEHSNLGETRNIRESVNNFDDQTRSSFTHNEQEPPRFDGPQRNLKFENRFPPFDKQIQNQFQQFDDFDQYGDYRDDEYGNNEQNLGPNNRINQGRFPPNNEQFGPNNYNQGNNRFGPQKGGFNSNNQQNRFGPDDDNYGNNQNCFGPNQDKFVPNQNRFDQNQGRFGNQDNFAPRGGQDKFNPNQNNRFGPNKDNFRPNQDFHQGENRFGPNQQFPRNQDRFGPNRNQLGPNNNSGPSNDRFGYDNGPNQQANRFGPSQGRQMQNFGPNNNNNTNNNSNRQFGTPPEGFNRHPSFGNDSFSNRSEVDDGFDPEQDNRNQSWSQHEDEQEVPEAPQAPSVKEEEILKPATVIDYDHKSLKKDVEVLLEPIRMFDYRHKSLTRIPLPERPKWLSETVKFIREFDPPIVRPYETANLRRYPPPPSDPWRNERDRYPRSVEYDDKDWIPPDNWRREGKFQQEQKKLFPPVPDLELEDNISDPEWDDDDNNEVQNANKQECVSNIKFGQGPPKSNTVLIEDILNPPGRYNRPPRIVIILRGPPGSGKTYLAKLIKDREVENGGSAPRILSLDDYFMVEQEKEIIEDGKKVKIKDMVYEYEAEMEDSYRVSLIKSFKKTITDGYFSFIIVDNVNEKVKYFGEMWSFAKQNGFQVYVCQMDLDIQTCSKRNIHGRTEADIAKCVEDWEPTPSHHPILDATSLLQSASICEVEMEEVNSPESEDFENDTSEDQVARSKWDNFDCSVHNLAKLDGLSKPLRPSRTMEEYLQLDTEWTPIKFTKPGQKRVRWADLEERKEQEKMRAIGFVVGQTNWDRMMDPTEGGSALTQTKYIEKTGRQKVPQK